MLYHSFYKKYVVHKSTTFLNPTIINGKEFELPRLSVLHYISNSNNTDAPSKSLPYFNNTKSLMYHVLEYKNTPIGHPKSRNKESVIFNTLKKDRDFKHIPYQSKKLTIRPSELLVYNYGSLSENYKYSMNKLNPYYRYKNMMTTVCDNIKDIGRDHYININVPNEIVDRNTLDRHIGPVTLNVLKYIDTFELFILLDIWRLLHPDFRESSNFYHIKDDVLKRVHLILNFNNKLVVLKLDYILGLIMDYKLKTADTVLSDHTVRKMLLNVYLQMIHMNDGIKLNTNKITESSFKRLVEHDLDTTLDSFKYKNVDDTEEDTDSEDIIKDTIDLSKLLNREYKNIDAIYSEELDNFDVDRKVLDDMFNNKIIGKSDYNKAIASLDGQDLLLNPYTHESLKDSVKYTPTEFDIKKSEVVIPDSYTTVDKTMLNDTHSVLTSKYIENTYKKDIINTVFSLQKSGIYIEDYIIEEEASILGTIEHHSIQLKPIDGKPSTLRFRLPKVDKDGTYMQSGNTYTQRKQRADKPIRKIDSLKVALSTAYGKSFVTKATYKKDDLGFWFQKQLIGLSSDGKVSNLVFVSSKIPDVQLPSVYTSIARYTKSFKYGNIEFYFGYNDRSILTNQLLSKIEKNNKVVIGKDSKSIYLMDDNGLVFKYIDGKYTELEHMYSMLKLDTSRLPIEFSNIKVFKKYIPVGLLIAYYLGFDNLLKTLNARYTVYDKRERISLENYEYVVTFNDYKYVLDRREIYNSLLVGGIASFNKVLKMYSRDTLNNRSDFSIVFSHLIPERLGIYMSEFDLLENMFVDTVSVTILKEMKEPTTFKGLLLRATELLITEHYPHPNSIKGSIVKGYDRVSFMLYNELIRGLRIYKQKSGFNKSKLDMSPFVVWNAMGDDSTSILVDDLNPLASIKQVEELTYTGAGGRTSTTMNKASRAWHVSEIGVVSEGHKDNGDVGLSADMSANPKIKNTRGFTDDFNFKKDGWTSILSTNGNMNFGITNDDPKRSNFSNVQGSHVVPINGGESPYIRTGYDYIFAYKVNDKFALVAKQDGIITGVSKSNISIEYEDKTVINHKLGDWSSKEESDSAYKHITVTHLIKNDKFKHGDVIAYDKTIFELDMFDNTKLVYKPFYIAKMTMLETISTYEDSSSIHKRLNDKLGVQLYKTKSFTLEMDTNIVDIVKINDKVDIDTRLYTIADSITGNTKLDSKALEILQRLSNNSPKAKYNGVIDKIEVRYYGELEEASDSVIEFVKESNKRIGKNYGKDITGEVDNQYSINGKPLSYGQMEIKFYIAVSDGIQQGDKFVFGLQLKNTIGESIDYPITTVDTKEDIDIVFSRRSTSARIVTAQDIRSTTNTLLKAVGKNLLSIGNRKDIENYVIKYVTKIAGNNNKKIYEIFFKGMNNVQFKQFLKNIEDGTWKINVIVPNGVNVLSVENNYKVAKELGVEFYQYLDIGPKGNLPKYRTPVKALIYDSEVRRVSQLLMKKISIPEDNRKVDITTGAVTGESRGSKLTMPELVVLTSYGMEDSLSELMVDRGGDLGGGRAMEAYLDKYGSVNLANLKNHRSGVISSKTLSAYLNACHLKNNVKQ